MRWDNGFFYEKAEWTRGVHLEMYFGIDIYAIL